MDLASLFFFFIKAMKRNSIFVSHKNKGVIKYVFCRKWAVRNPAGTRLDSSGLVKRNFTYAINQSSICKL